MTRYKLTRRFLAALGALMREPEDEPSPRPPLLNFKTDGVILDDGSIELNPDALETWEKNRTLQARGQRILDDAARTALAMMNGHSARRSFKTEGSAQKYADDVLNAFPHLEIYASIEKEAANPVRPYHVAFRQRANPCG